MKPIDFYVYVIIFFQSCFRGTIIDHKYPDYKSRLHNITVAVFVKTVDMY